MVSTGELLAYRKMSTRMTMIIISASTPPPIYMAKLLMLRVP